MASDSVEGAMMTVGTARLPAALAMPAFSANASFGANATRSGLGTAPATVPASGLAAVDRGCATWFMIVPLLTGSATQTGGLKVWLTKPAEDALGNSDGTLRFGVADLTVTAGAGAVPSGMVPAGVSALFATTIVPDSTTTPLLPSGVYINSPGSNYTGCVLVNAAGCDLELEFAIDSGSASGLNALVYRL